MPIFNFSEKNTEWLAICYGVALFTCDMPIGPPGPHTEEIDMLGFITRRKGKIEFKGRWKFKSGHKMVIESKVKKCKTVAAMIADVNEGLVDRMGKSASDSDAIWDLSTLQWAENPSGEGWKMVELMERLPHFEMDITRREATPEELAQYGD